MIAGIVAAVVAGVFVMIAAQARRPMATSEEGDAIFVHPGIVRFVAYLGIGFGLAFLLSAFLFATSEEFILVLVVSTGFLLLGGSLWIEGYCFKILLTQDGRMVCHSGWRKTRIVPLAEVTRVDFSQSMQWYRLHTAHHGIIRVHTMVQGHMDLIRIAEAAIELNKSSDLQTEAERTTGSE